MIRIAKDKLIIEIRTERQEPLALLADFQKGIISMMALVPFAADNIPPEQLETGIIYITNLLQEMTISQDQGRQLNKSLTTEQTELFNQW